MEIKKKSKQVQVATHLKEHHRHFLRGYFTTAYPDSMNFLYQEVLLLLNSPEINTLEEDLGTEKYNKLISLASQFSSMYSKMQLNIYVIIKLREMGSDSDIVSKKIKEFQKEITMLSFQIPAISLAIWKLYYLLVDNTNLAYLPVPRDGKYITSQQKTIGGGQGGYV